MGVQVRGDELALGMRHVGELLRVLARGEEMHACGGEAPPHDQGELPSFELDALDVLGHVLRDVGRR
jgi:hypothetical protein